MKKYFLLLILILFGINDIFCQIKYLENFDSKKSLKGWNIKTNGLIVISDSFIFNGTTFKKSTRDSFMVFYDTSKNWNYFFGISKKFKVVPCKSLKIKSSLFSLDSLNDFISFGFRLYDSNNKKLFNISLPFYKNENLGIGGNGIDFTMIKDSVWNLADSMEIEFHYNPINPYNFVERLGIIDEIYLRELLTTTILLEKQNFKIYPNPAQNILNIELQSIDNDQNHIEIYDLSGKQVYSSITSDKNIQVDVSELTQGLYIIKVYNNNFVLNQKFIKE